MFQIRSTRSYARAPPGLHQVTYLHQAQSGTVPDQPRAPFSLWPDMGHYYTRYPETVTRHTRHQVFACLVSVKLAACLRTAVSTPRRITVDIITLQYAEVPTIEHAIEQLTGHHA